MILPGPFDCSMVTGLSIASSGFSVPGICALIVADLLTVVWHGRGYGISCFICFQPSTTRSEREVGGSSARSIRKRPSAGLRQNE